MTKLQTRIVILYAQKNMKISEVARKIGLTHSKVDTALRQVKQETGLDPWNFFDLHKLYQMVGGEVPE